MEMDMLMVKHILKSTDLNEDEINELIQTGIDIYNNPAPYGDLARGKTLCSLFYEASTRTRLSFESAMGSLGGHVISVSDINTSSATKGESLPDTIRMVNAYSDIIVIRHPKEGSAYLASMYSQVPIVNGGDGGHQHPTQTLTDLITIYAAKKRLDGLKIGLCGDLKFGRTVHSLVEAMCRYPNNEYTLISPNELKIPEYLRDETLKRHNIPFTEVSSLEQAIPNLDILYMTRVQKERFFNEEDYIRLKDAYILDKSKLYDAKQDLAILHPLPRNAEISTDVDNDPRALYFEQARYGKAVRMALIIKLLELKG
jgi:aspartate carbamoyltransferase catalytic subunit